MSSSIEFKRSKFPATLDLLAQIESEAGFPIPANVRSHFIQHNGGDASHCILNDGCLRRLRFVPLAESSVVHIPDAHLVGIAFARESKAGTYCVVLDADRSGRIVEVERRLDVPVRFVRFVSNSFVEFMSRLEPDPDDPWEPRHGYNQMNLDQRSYVDFVPYLPSRDAVNSLRGPVVTASIEFVNCLAPVTDEHFAWMEEAFRIRIPADVRAHYQRFNGGVIKSTISDKPLCFRVRNMSHMLHEFFGMQFPTPGRQSDTGLGYFEDVCAQWKWIDRYTPAYLWPFASSSPYGDLICFSTRQQDFGSIWRGFDEYTRGVQKLADSFNEFLNMLDPLSE